MVCHTITDDQSFTGEFWGPLLGLCLKSEVAIQDYVSDAVANPFAGVDKRMSPGSSLWERACQAGVEVHPDSDPLAFRWGAGPHGRQGPGTTDEVSAFEKGCTSHCLGIYTGLQHDRQHDFPDEPSVGELVLSTSDVQNYVHSVSSCEAASCLPRACCPLNLTPEVPSPTSALHSCRHPMPLKVRFEAGPKDQYNARVRALSRLVARLDRQVLQTTPSLTDSVESKVGSLSNLAPHHQDGPVYLKLPKPQSTAPVQRVRDPTALQRIIAEALPLQPADLAGPVIYQPVRELIGLLSQAALDGDGYRFTVFDVTFHLQVRNRGPDWSLLDCIADAVSSAGTRTRAVQLIRHPMPGLPEPQIVLTPASASPRASALPIDLRGFGFSVYTVEAEPEQSAADIVAALQTVRAGRRRLLDNGLEPPTLDFQDTQNQSHHAAARPSVRA